MGRNNRSRKRRDEMNRIKRERYAAKDLARLKKTLGLIDADGNEIMKDVSDVVTIKTSKQIRKDKLTKEEEELLAETLDKKDPGENIEVVNENTGKKHKYNTKTLKDEYGSYPPWFKRKNSEKRQRKKMFAKQRDFKQAWSTSNIPL